MKHIGLQIFAALTLLLVMLAVQACDDATPTSEIAVTDVAVLRSSAGGETTFAVVDGGRVAALTAPGQISSELVKPGEAFLVRFIPVADSRVDITGYSPINNLKTIVTDSPDSIAGWDATPVRLLSYVVIDRHLIFHAGLPYSTDRREIRLVVMPGSEPARAEAYLFQKLDSDAPTFVRDYYFSFDLNGNDMDTITSVTLHVNNSNLPLKTIEIPLNQ